MVQALVTGAAGFTGSHLVRHLKSHGLSVRAMVRNPGDARKVEEAGAEAVIADLNDPASLRDALSNVSTVFHIAALFRKAGLPNSEFHRVNVEGTRNLLDAAVAAKVDKVIHCSTVGVLGHIEHPPANEVTPYNPGDPYQLSKMEGEKLFLEYVRQGKLTGTVIRPAMIYGPGDQRTLKLFKGVATGRFFYVGPGTALVHFIDVRDLAEAFRLASIAPNVNGETFIIAGESAYPLNQVTGWIAEILGVPAPWLHLPVRPMQMLGTLCEKLCRSIHMEPPLHRRRVDFFTKDRCFDCTKAKKVLGFKPSKPILAELIEIIESYVESGAIPRNAPRPSAMLRTLTGKINVWNKQSSELYGWSPDQAVGEASHSLLKTEFPNDLVSINRKLEEEGRWEGILLHKDSRGRPLKVRSTWQLARSKTQDSPLVLELNRPLDSGIDLHAGAIGIGALSSTAIRFASVAVD